jgi:DNA-binding HxlR family transcriptional regulator
VVTVGNALGPRKTAPRGNARGRRGDLFDPACPTRRLLDRIGGKWTSMLVKVLGDAGGEVRFAELQRRAPGISRKMLAQTLSELARDGLVIRRVEPTVPPAVHYSLSPLGRTLIEPLDALRAWAETHMATVDDHRAAVDAATSAPG